MTNAVIQDLFIVVCAYRMTISYVPLEIVEAFFYVNTVDVLCYVIFILNFVI